jgi:hypothetical protein
MTDRSASAGTAPAARRRQVVPACLVVSVAVTILAMPAAVAGRLAAAAAIDSRTQAAAPADPPATAAEVPALDPTVREVVRMLGAKVSEPVVLQWLQVPGHKPAKVGSREVIEIKRAGASDGFVKSLLEIAGKTGPGQTPVGAPPAGTPSPAAAPATPVKRPPPPPHAALLHWTIEYHPNFAEDDVAWDLYVYLDGHYLAWIKAPLVSFLDKPLEFDRSLAAGHHVLRLIQERHDAKADKTGWSNEARVAPAALPFDVVADTPGQVEIHCEVRRRGGPLSLEVRQDSRTHVSSQPHIGQPETWPALCEEISLTDTAGKDPRWTSTRAQTTCLHWGDLWPAADEPPSRDDVRDELARQGFHPAPASDGQ